MPRPLRVFLCHASQDKPAVRELYKRLLAETWIDPWLDEEKLLGGQDFDLEIYKATRDADAIIVCLSKKSVIKEGYINKEIRRALDIAQEKAEGAIYVIPLRLDECNPSFEKLKKLHWVDYFTKNAHEKLLNSLRARASSLGITQEDPPPLNPFLWGVVGIFLATLIFFAVNFLAKNWPISNLQGQSTATLTATLPPTPLREITLTPSLTAAPAFHIGSTMMSDKDGMTLVYVPAGEFTMGSRTVMQQVYLDAFWIDKTEVTNHQYQLCIADGLCDPLSSVKSRTRDRYFGNQQYDNYPVIYIDWKKANDYCSWAGRRLPFDAEWEKAARGTDGRTYPWGNELPNNDLLNFNGKVYDTTEVGRYPDGASIYGALDMAGNVNEWVVDWFMLVDGDYKIDTSLDPFDLEAGQFRALRGGDWYIYSTGVQTTSHAYTSADNGNVGTGFRCVISQP